MMSETDKLLKEFASSTDSSSEKKSRALLSQSTFEAEMRAVTLQMHRDYYSLRKSWSKHILKAFWLLIIFEILFISALGFGIINFHGYTALPQVIIGAFFANIVGLVVIVAKFLFPDSSQIK
jgi:hypothetical protein